MVKRIFAQAYLWILLLLLYSPIVIIVIYSFTEAKVLGNWTGFSTKLYSSLFTTGTHHSLMNALINTVTVALIAATASTLLGSITAIGIFNLKSRARKTIGFVNSIPILNGDIITGISLFLLFVSLGISQGYTTVVLAHITFCTPYVVLSVLPRLKQMNPNLYEAVVDLNVLVNVAQIFYFLTNVLLVIILTMCEIRWQFVIQVVYAVIFVGSAIVLTAQKGLLGFSIAACISSILYFLLTTIVGFVFAKKNGNRQK